MTPSLDKNSFSMQHQVTDQHVLYFRLIDLSEKRVPVRQVFSERVQSRFVRRSWSHLIWIEGIWKSFSEDNNVEKLQLRKFNDYQQIETLVISFFSKWLRFSYFALLLLPICNQNGVRMLIRFFECHFQRKVTTWTALLNAGTGMTLCTWGPPKHMQN